MQPGRVSPCVLPKDERYEQAKFHDRVKNPKAPSTNVTVWEPPRHYMLEKGLRTTNRAFDFVVAYQVPGTI